MEVPNRSVLPRWDPTNIRNSESVQALPVCRCTYALHGILRSNPPTSTAGSLLPEHNWNPAASRGQVLVPLRYFWSAKLPLTGLTQDLALMEATQSSLLSRATRMKTEAQTGSRLLNEHALSRGKISSDFRKITQIFISPWDLRLLRVWLSRHLIATHSAAFFEYSLNQHIQAF